MVLAKGAQENSLLSAFLVYVGWIVVWGVGYCILLSRLLRSLLSLMPDCAKSNYFRRTILKMYSLWGKGYSNTNNSWTETIKLMNLWKIFPTENFWQYFLHNLPVKENKLSRRLMSLRLKRETLGIVPKGSLRENPCDACPRSCRRKRHTHATPQASRFLNARIAPFAHRRRFRAYQLSICWFTSKSSSARGEGFNPSVTISRDFFFADCVKSNYFRCTIWKM